MAARRQLLDLYRRVLRTNRAVLPRPMRLLGDGYAQEEWRRQRKGNASEKQWEEFANMWTAYCDFLVGKPGSMDRSGELSDNVMSRLTAEQKMQLKSLKEAIDLFRK
eukprot:scaffold281_cov318-Pavlova_lutheri.AAC.8